MNMKRTNLKPRFDIVRKNGDLSWRIICKSGDPAAATSIVVGFFRNRSNASMVIGDCRQCCDQLDDEFFRRDMEIWYPEFFAQLKVDYSFYDDYEPEVVAELLQEDCDESELTPQDLSKISGDRPLEFYAWMGRKLNERRMREKGWL